MSDTQETCRGCRLPILPGEPRSEVAAYWTPHAKYAVHKACKTLAIKTEAFECQLIDADCNDCKHFERDLTWQKREGSSGGGQPGRCQKFGKPTRAWPNTCTGHACFEHRRA